MDVQELVEAANQAWQLHVLPRPMMTQTATLQFAYDWPVVRLFSPVCCRCRFRPGRKRDVMIDHLNTKHPGWLEEWNAGLREGGVVQ